LPAIYEVYYIIARNVAIQIFCCVGRKWGETLNNLGDKGNFFKNPIGVIGIFLVLTEAIASMVIVKSSLDSVQNTILVLFIVLFPCLVLFVFYLLVTRHHEKLYSPSDYKDEKNFVNTYLSINQNMGQIF